MGPTFIGPLFLLCVLRNSSAHAADMLERRATHGYYGFPIL
jgi:hypothetical protein